MRVYFTFVATMQTISIENLFRGLEPVLQKCLQDIAEERSATAIAKDHLEPILGHLEANAGVELDPVYLVYMLMAAREQANREHAMKN
jgi:hypothetical protein